MTTLSKTINKLNSLKGAEVRIFGQKRILNNEVDKYTIDTIEILKNLKEFEIQYFQAETLDDDDNYIVVDFDEAEEYIDYLIENGDYIESGHYNTYNWNCNISNDIDFIVYKSEYDSSVLVSLMVHLYGDVRSNYTDKVLLKFDYEDDFEEIFLGHEKTVNISYKDKEYNCIIKFLTDNYEIFDNEGVFISDAYSINDDNDFIEILKDNLV